MTSRAGQGYQDWEHLRNHIIAELNGETPHPVTEQTIIDAYQLHPDATEKAALQCVADFQQGNIRSGWAILRHRADAILTPPANPKAKTGRETEKQRQRAEQWIRNAGLYTPHWQACRDALTEDLHLEPATADQLQPLYDELHPHGLQAERDAITRAEQWKASRAKVEAALRKPGALTDTPLPDDIPLAPEPSQDDQPIPA